jgi:hypothetical protein
MRRLRELSSLLRFRLPSAADSTKHQLPDPTQHIFMEKGIYRGPELMQRLQALGPMLRQQATTARPVKLIVLDSIAAVFRDLGDGGASSTDGNCAGVAELAGRTEILFKISALLRCVEHLGDAFGVGRRCAACSVWQMGPW